MLKRGREKGLLEINVIDLRSFGEGKHRQVDDRPYGGGPGMVLMAGPVIRAVRSVKKKQSRVIYLSPQGTPLTANKCETLAKSSHLILLCGHYEGVDERALELVVDEEISIGDYVLTSGAPAAAVLIDAVSRFVPGVIGNKEAAYQDSFTNGMLEGPLYTRPHTVEGHEVPEVLCLGNHAEIDGWKQKRAWKKTERIRPDLIDNLTSL